MIKNDIELDNLIGSGIKISSQQKINTKRTNWYFSPPFFFSAKYKKFVPVLNNENNLWV